MKIRLWLFLSLIGIGVVTIFTVSSCAKAKQLAAFDVNYTFPKVYFSYSPKLQKQLPEFTLFTVKLSVNMDSILSANHIPSGIIASAYLSKLAMVITNPPDANFNWLQSVKMVGSVDSTFSQPLLLGSDTLIAAGSKTIDLAINKIDIKPIFFKNSYYLKILATPSGQIPAASVNMYLESAIRLHIEPL